MRMRKSTTLLLTEVSFANAFEYIHEILMAYSTSIAMAIQSNITQIFMGHHKIEQCCSSFSWLNVSESLSETEHIYLKPSFSVGMICTVGFLKRFINDISMKRYVT